MPFLHGSPLLPSHETNHAPSLNLHDLTNGTGVDRRTPSRFRWPIRQR